MKKVLSLLVTLVLVLAAITASADGFGMVNPWTEFDSLEELNEAAGTNLSLPGVMGVEAKANRFLNGEDYSVAELIFDVNGIEYTLRGAGTTVDISGVCMADGKTAFEGSEFEPFAIAQNDDMKLARWLNIDGQYVLIAADNGILEAETFEGIAQEMMMLTNSFELMEIAEGTYYDSVSRRASAVVTKTETGDYAIEIHWADSAFEDNVWEMTAKKMEDGLLVYDDCVCKHVVTKEDGSFTEAYANLIPDGYFAVAEDKLLWTGAADEGCRDCVFELPQE